jgi:hypothetical protein
VYYFNRLVKFASYVLPITLRSNTYMHARTVVSTQIIISSSCNVHEASLVNDWLHAYGTEQRTNTIEFVR